MENNNINFKEFDSFIQKCLDKYFYVEPWKKLYERTGKFHKDIISDKPTIPDLIIYNKIFNKKYCFYESNPNSYIKFPRMRFILRPKFKKEYNPTSTYGKANEVIIYKLQKKSQVNKDLNSFENKIEKELDKQKAEKDLGFKNNIENKQNDNFERLKEPKENNSDINKEEEEEEDEPEWANDEVNEYFNKEEIKFKAIPKSIEEKINELNEINENIHSIPKEIKKEVEKFDDKINKEEKNPDDKININIDNFFSDEKGITFENIDKINSQNKEQNNSINNKNENKKINDNTQKIIKMENNGTFTNLKSIELNINSNEHFNSFQENNKFKNNYLGEENSNVYNTNPEIEIQNKIKQNITQMNLNRLKLQEFKKFLEQNKNKLNANYNFNNQMNNLNDSLRFNNNQNFQTNQNHIYNIHNNNYLVNLNNINYYPYNNNQNINNIPNNNLANFNNINNAYIQRNNINFPNNLNINMNSKESYVNNLNNMIFKAQNIAKNNLIHNMNIIQNKMYTNNIPLNYNNMKNIQTNQIVFNSQAYNNYSPFYNNINNNLNKINIESYIKKVYQNNINNANQNKFNSTEDLKNEKENENQDFEPLDFSENPNKILLKNLNQKKWIVIEKDKNNYILNFNTQELYEYLKGKGKECFKDLSINDSDTDYFFPTDEIYENLKKFYSQCI